MMMFWFYGEISIIELLFCLIQVWVSNIDAKAYSWELLQRLEIYTSQELSTIHRVHNSARRDLPYAFICKLSFTVYSYTTQNLISSLLFSSLSFSFLKMSYQHKISGIIYSLEESRTVAIMSRFSNWVCNRDCSSSAFLLRNRDIICLPTAI